MILHIIIVVYYKYNTIFIKIKSIFKVYYDYSDSLSIFFLLLLNFIILQSILFTK